MREKDKQDSFSGDRFSGTTEEIRAGASVRGPAPAYDYDETLARRAGEIIARAVSAAGRIVRGASKRKY
jgi:hypothetical protein